MKHSISFCLQLCTYRTSSFYCKASKALATANITCQGHLIFAHTIVFVNPVLSLCHAHLPNSFFLLRYSCGSTGKHQPPSIPPPQLSFRTDGGFPLAIPGDIVLGVVTVVGQPPKKEGLVSDEGEAVSKTRTRWPWTPPGRSRLKTLPLPAAGLQLVQLVGILAVLHHTAKDEQAGAIADKAICCTAWRNVALHWWNEPLVGGCSHKKKRKRRLGFFYLSTLQNLIEKR